MESAIGNESAVSSSRGALPASFSEVLVEVVDSVFYQPKQFAEELAKQPQLVMIDPKRENVVLSNAVNALFNLTVNSRVPLMDELFQQQWQLERYIFTYQSVSAITGADTLLMGVVTFPNNMQPGVDHQVGTLTLHSHQAAFDESWLPTKSVSPMTIHALHNSAVVEPDLMGIETFEDDGLTRKCDNGDLLGLEMLHCTMAALEVMRQHGVTLADDGYTNSWASSLTMREVFGFAQYMENEASEEVAEAIRLKASFTGEGPVLACDFYTTPNRYDPANYKYLTGWQPRLPLYMACYPGDDMVSYPAVKAYNERLVVNPDGSVNKNVHWFDFNVTHIGLMDMVGLNHFVVSTLMLLYMSTVEDPADMEKVTN
jgi:hypothetical protein